MHVAAYGYVANFTHVYFSELGLGFGARLAVGGDELAKVMITIMLLVVEWKAVS